MLARALTLPQEIEQLIAEWNPKPLVEEEQLQEIRDSCINVSKKESDVPVLSSSVGPRVTLAGDGDGAAGQQIEYLNFASTGFLDYQVNESVINAAVRTLRTNGVGSCGPRGTHLASTLLATVVLSGVFV